MSINMPPHVGSVLGDRLHQRLNDASVGVEQVVTGHARLAGHASRNNDEISTLQAGAQLLGAGVASNLSPKQKLVRTC